MGRGAWRGRTPVAVLAMALASCGISRDMTVREATTDLVGLSANDLRLCAGLPERTATGAGGAEFWSYERSATTGGANIALQRGGLNLSGLEECRAVFELAGGRVTRLAFMRTTSSGGAARAACAPLVRTCEEMVDRGALAR